MFKAFVKGRKKKTTSKANAKLQKGVHLLRGKLYKQAMIELNLALDLDKEKTVDRLIALFTDYYKANEYEACLSIGLILIKTRPQDYELCNRVGNIARKLHNYKQANNLYRQALRSNKNFSIAFYNLAASMGKVDKFDGKVIRDIKRFNDMSRYILPDYQNDQTIVEELTRQWEEQDKNSRESKYQLRERIYSHLSRTIEKSRKGKPSSEETRILHGNIFNIGLYAISQVDGDTAIEYLAELINEGSHMPYVRMLCAIAKEMTGNIQEAIDEMVALLGENQDDRYLNANLGFMYQKVNNRLLSVKYFAIAASLLEKSGGKFSQKEILKIADKHFENGESKKALPLYQLIATEIKSLHAMLQIGEIYLLNQDYVNAHQVFAEIIELHPNSELARKKLRKIHEHYFEKGNKLFNANKIAQAVVLYERALSIERTSRALESTAKAYLRLRNFKKASGLMEEFEEMKRNALTYVQEREREQYVVKGKYFMQKKDFNSVIDNFEKAFRIRMDKDIFVYLAHLYKGLNRRNALNNLLYRWQQWLTLQKRQENIHQ